MFRPLRQTRRSFVQLGLSGLLTHGVGIGAFPTELVAKANAGSRKPIQSCILIMYYGGPSHVDTWDMKPNASVEVRGEFKPISTSIPGRFVCEHLPKTAQIVDRLAVIRSMHHRMTNHNAAMYEALIGRLPAGGDAELLEADRLNDFPNHGAILSYLAAKGELTKSAMPLVNVALPHVMHNVVRLAGQNAGFLGAKYDPFQVERDPNAADFRIDELNALPDVPHQRLQARRELLEQLNQLPPIAVGHTDLDAGQRRAFELLGKNQVQRAFEIGREPDKVRDRYGRHRLGQSMVLARRLVEASVRFINVNDKIYNGQTANWDCHLDNFPRHRELLPPADQAYSALILDLEQRGLLESTLVVAMGEFGRTPKINLNAGRDHWPDCYSVVLAGGGVTGGATYGASDEIGAYPVSNPVEPADLSATLFWRFGLDHRQEIQDAFSRPFPVADGDPITALFA